MASRKTPTVLMPARPDLVVEIFMVAHNVRYDENRLETGLFGSLLTGYQQQAEPGFVHLIFGQQFVRPIMEHVGQVLAAGVSVVG